MGFGPNSDPFINQALGSGRRSNPTIDHAALGFGISSGCHATSGSNQNSDPITIHAAVSSDPNSNPSTSHALGFDRHSDPITDRFGFR